MNTHYTTSVTPTITAGAYAASDVVGGLMTFDVAHSSIGGGILNAALLVDDGNVGAALTLYLFDNVPTTIADNAAFAPTAADLALLVCSVSFSSYTTLNSNQYALTEDINTVFATPRGILYGYLVCTATPTYASTSDLTVKLTVSGARGM